MTSAELVPTPLRVDADGTSLLGDRWAGEGPPIVLLHAGVCDRRSWYATAALLGDVGPVLAYDRRGFGETPPSSTEYGHLEDLVAVLDQQAGAQPAWLVGSSMGGLLALECALAHPERVAGLVLIGPAASGAPDVGSDDASQRLEVLLMPAYEAQDWDEVKRLEAWMWLDGPTAAEGRVGGAARALALDMNTIVLRNESSGGPEATYEPHVWPRLGELAVPVTVAWGDLDVADVVRVNELMVEQIPGARRVVLPGMGHLPYLEDPAVVAALIRDAVTAG